MVKSIICVGEPVDHHLNILCILYYNVVPVYYTWYFGVMSDHECVSWYSCIMIYNSDIWKHLCNNFNHCIIINFCIACGHNSLDTITNGHHNALACHTDAATECETALDEKAEQLTSGYDILRTKRQTNRRRRCIQHIQPSMQI